MLASERRAGFDTLAQVCDSEESADDLVMDHALDDTDIDGDTNVWDSGLLRYCGWPALCFKYKHDPMLWPQPWRYLRKH